MTSRAWSVKRRAKRPTWSVVFTLYALLSTLYVSSLLAAGGDNTYCSSSETWIGPASDGPAALPQTCVRTAMSDTPTGMTVKWACPTGQMRPDNGQPCDFYPNPNNKNLGAIQTAMNAAAGNCGWWIKIKSTSDGTPSGSQNVYDENINLPDNSTCSKNNWNWVTTDQVDGLPSEGTRISPCWAGISSLPGRPPYNCPAQPGVYVPKIRGVHVNACTIAVSTTTAFWRFIGLEVTSRSDVAVNNRLIDSAGSAIGKTDTHSSDHIVWDRLLVHGGDDPKGQSAQPVPTGLRMSGTYLALIDSYIYDLHCNGYACNESHGIGWGTGRNPQGPTKVVNNFIESGSLPWITGGSGTAITPTDAELRRNHNFKPLFWNRWCVAPLPAFCNGQTYTDPANLNGNHYVNIKNGGEFKNMNRALLEGNIIENTWMGQSDQDAQIISLNTIGNSSDTTRVTVNNITVRYNILRHGNKCIGIANEGTQLVPLGPTGSMSIHDDLCDDVNGAKWSTSGTGNISICFRMHNSAMGVNGSEIRYVSVNHVTCVQSDVNGFNGNQGGGWMMGLDDAASPATPWPGIYLTNTVGSGSVYSMANAVSGQGAVVTANYFLDSHANSDGWRINNDVMASKQMPKEPKQTPYPTQNPNGATVVNYDPVTLATVGFVNYNGGDGGGDYHLSSASPYKNGADDGKDIGADIDALNCFTYGTDAGLPILGSCSKLQFLPVITSPLTSSGTVGEPYSYQITANAPIKTYGVTGLPASGSLILDTNTGLISGTPNSADVGTYNVNLTVTNSTGTGSAYMSLAIYPVGGGGSGPGVPTLSLPAFLPINGTITAGYSSNDPASYFSWTFTPMSQPAASSKQQAGTSTTSLPLAARGSLGGAPAAALRTSSPMANLGTVSLGLGPYQVAVTVTDNNGVVSAPAQAYVTLVAADLSGVRIYPNPWRSDKHMGRSITFDNLTVNTTVKIFTISGHHVKTLPISSTAVTWDLTNDSGDKVASGLYIYDLKTADGQKKTGKVAVIK